MYIRTKYHPATNYKGQRLSVSVCDGNGAVLVRSYISFGEIDHYNFSSITEEVLFALERFFDIQRKKLYPLLMGTNPIDTAWNWTGIQLTGHDWIFTDQLCITAPHTVKFMRECIVKSMQSLTPPTK